VIRFDAVEGNEQAKLALALVAVDPGIGGVLLVGPPGVAKSTLARQLAAVLGDAPFVEVPLGATEDRIKGSIDVASALRDGQVRVRSGLLGQADGGVLYLDEVNLQPDHVVDLLLDAAASGVNRIERDGVSAVEPARFALVATMNPEEGSLRPQLRDRFAMVVTVRPPADRAARLRALRRALAGEPASLAGDQRLVAKARARLEAVVLEPVLGYVVEVVERVGVSSLRADLAIVRAARAHAALAGRSEVDEADVDAVVGLVLEGRAGATAPSGAAPGASVAPPRERAPRGHREDITTSAASSAERSGGESAPSEPEATTTANRATAPGNPPTPVAVEVAEASPLLRGRVKTTARGRDAGARGRGANGALSVSHTILAWLERGGTGPIASDDLRRLERVRREQRCVVLVVDASGSQAAETALALAQGVVEELLGHAYRSRAHVAVVALGGAGASVVLRPTRSLEVARQRLAAIERRGATPLAAGLAEAAALAVQLRHRGMEPLVVVVTDGRPTVGDDEGRGPIEATLAAANGLGQLGVDGLVVEVSGRRDEVASVAGRLAEAARFAHVVATPA